MILLDRWRRVLTELRRDTVSILALISGYPLYCSGVCAAMGDLMANQQWKADERVVATRMQGQRVALSGGPGASSKADVLAPGWFIEVKRRARFVGAGWLAKARESAQLEHRRAVVVVHVAHTQRWTVLLDLADFEYLLGLGGPVELAEAGPCIADDLR